MTRMDVRSLAEANINKVLSSSQTVAVSHASIPFEARPVSEFLGDKKSAQIAATDIGLVLLGWANEGGISVLPLTGTSTALFPTSEPGTKEHNQTR